MTVKVDYSSLYHQLGRLLETAPDLSSYQACVAPAAMQWLGRAHATVNAAYVGSGIDAIAFKMAVDRLASAAWASGVTEIFQILYRALAHCELRLPPGAAGAFVPVGNSFDAFTALAKIFVTASADVMIVDPYLDHSVLTDFAAAVPEGVALRLLADENDHKATLGPAAQRWASQYGANRPLSVRLAPRRTLHDRAIFIDRRDAWTLTQSLKDFAKRAPAEIVRADSIAALKLEAYEALWASATVLL
jgi:hypothetical protein